MTKHNQDPAKSRAPYFLLGAGIILVMVAVIWALQLKTQESQASEQPALSSRPDTFASLDTEQVASEDSFQTFERGQQILVATPILGQDSVSTPVWSDCHNTNFRITLPETYIAAFTDKTEVENVARWLDENGFSGDNFHRWVENASGLVYYAIDTKISPGLPFAYLTVTCGIIAQEYSLNDYEKWILTLLINGEKVVGQQSFTINGLDIRWIIYDFDPRGIIVRDDVFILNVDGQFWKFEFHSPVSEYPDRENTYIKTLSTLSFVD